MRLGDLLRIVQTSSGVRVDHVRGRAHSVHGETHSLLRRGLVKEHAVKIPAL